MEGSTLFASASSSTLNAKTPLQSLNTKRVLTSNGKQNVGRGNGKISPVFKYNLDTTPSKKVKLKPLMSSSKKDGAATERFGMLSTPSNLKFSTGKRKKLSSRKSTRKAFGVIRGPNDSSRKIQSHKKRVRNVKPLKKSNTESSSNTKPFFKQEKIFVNVPCGHLQNPKFKKCAEKRCLHECCKRYFQLEDISITEDEQNETKKVVRNSKGNVMSEMSASKKRMAPISITKTPVTKSRSVENKLQEQFTDEEDDEPLINHRPAILNGNNIYSQQKAKFDKLMEEHSKQASSFQVLLSSPEHAEDRANKPEVEDGKNSWANVDRFENVDDSVESVDDLSGWESDEPPPPPPPAEDQNDGLAGLNESITALDSTSVIIPPKLDLNPMFDRVITNQNTLETQDQEIQKSGPKSIEKLAIIKLSSQNYAKHFVKKLEASIASEVEMKMRESSEMDIKASKANGVTVESRPVTETSVSSNASKNLTSDDSVGVQSQYANLSKKGMKQSFATAATRETNASYSAPRSAKKRARVDSSISYSDNISMDENVLDSRKYFKISAKLRQISKKVDAKSKRIKMRKGFSLLMRNALNASGKGNRVTKSQKEIVNEELKRSTQIAEMVMRGNYNKLKKKIEEMSRRLEEEEEIAICAENRRISLMLEAEKEKERQHHRNFPRHVDLSEPPPAPSMQSHVPPPAPQMQSHVPPPAPSMTSTKENGNSHNTATNSTDPKYYQEYKDKTTFHGDLPSSRSTMQHVKAEVQDSGYKAAIEAFESVLEANPRDVNHHTALKSLKTFLHIDTENYSDTRPKTSIPHLKNVTNQQQARKKYNTPKEQFEVPQDFDALLEAMHISSIRRKVIKETTEPDFIRWNFRYLASSSTDDDEKEQKSTEDTTIVVVPEEQDANKESKK